METGLMYYKLKPNLTITRYFSFAKVLLMGLIIILPINATPRELSRCGRPLQLAIKGALFDASHLESCPVTSRLIQWLHLQQPGEPPAIVFPRFIAFYRNNPEWPLKDRIQIQAEESMSGDEKSQDIRKWFEENPPLTTRGKIFYARALVAAGRKNAAQKVIRDVWINSDLEGTALKPFWNDFKSYLTQEDHQQRVNRLLMQEKVSIARIMFPWLSDSYKALADARIALIKQSGDVDTKTSFTYLLSYKVAPPQRKQRLHVEAFRRNTPTKRR
jgi:hypothetical protein